MSDTSSPGTPRGQTDMQGHRPLLSFDKVEKRFARPDGSVSTAVGGVSLDIAEHEFVALIGPSGCGKTTLLRLANGLIEPDTGSVLIGGKTQIGERRVGKECRYRGWPYQ